jgi:hypothetical protein
VLSCLRFIAYWEPNKPKAAIIGYLTSGIITDTHSGIGGTQSGWLVAGLNDADEAVCRLKRTWTDLPTWQSTAAANASTRFLHLECGGEYMATLVLSEDLGDDTHHKLLPQNLDSATLFLGVGNQIPHTVLPFFVPIDSPNLSTEGRAFGVGLWSEPWTCPQPIGHPLPALSERTYAVVGHDACAVSTSQVSSHRGMSRKSRHPRRSWRLSPRPVCSSPTSTFQVCIERRFP